MVDKTHAKLGPKRSVAYFRNKLHAKLGDPEANIATAMHRYDETGALLARLGDYFSRATKGHHADHFKPRNRLHDNFRLATNSDYRLLDKASHLLGLPPLRDLNVAETEIPKAVDRKLKSLTTDIKNALVNGHRAKKDDETWYKLAEANLFTLTTHHDEQVARMTRDIKLRPGAQF